MHARRGLAGTNHAHIVVPISDNEWMARHDPGHGGRADYAMPVRVYVEDPERVNYRDGYQQASRGRPGDRSDWAGIAFGASGGLVFGAAEVGVATTVFPSSVLIPACVLGAVPVMVGGYLGHRDARIESARKAWCATDDDLRWALIPPTWRGRHRHPSAFAPQMPPHVLEAFITAASTWQDSIPLASQIPELHAAYRELHERMFEVMRAAPTFAPSDAVSIIVGQIDQWCGIITGLVTEYESNQHEIDQLTPEPETPHESSVVLETEAAAERIARARARLDAYQEIRSPVMSTHQVDPESSP